MCFSYRATNVLCSWFRGVKSAHFFGITRRVLDLVLERYMFLRHSDRRNSRALAVDALAISATAVVPSTH